MQHNEESEEDCKALYRHTAFFIVKPEQHAHKQCQENHSHAKYIIPHGFGYNEIRTFAGVLFHNTLTGRDRRQGQSGKGIHNQIHPQHLRYGQRQFSTHQRTQQHNEQCHEVNRQLEYDEALDILIQ